MFDEAVCYSNNLKRHGATVITGAHTQNHQTFRQKYVPETIPDTFSQNTFTKTDQPANCTNYQAVPGEFTRTNFILQSLSVKSCVGDGWPLIGCRFAVRFHGNQIKISVTTAPKRDSNKRKLNVCFG